MPTPEPEAASIRRESAWARLVERRWEALVARAARRLDRAQAEDVVQDVFVAAVVIAGGPEPPAWLDAWLAARVDRACDVRRNRAARCAGRVVPLEAGDAANPNDRGGFARHPNFQHANDPKTNDGAGAGSILGADDVGAFVRAELARLDAPVRAAMERRWLVGRSVREVARELGVSKSAVEERLARGMRAMRARLGALGREMER
jgi:DNA-directed RNA polymerase specialized sigma24 family protein